MQRRGRLAMAGLSWCAQPGWYRRHGRGLAVGADLAGPLVRGGGEQFFLGPEPAQHGLDGHSGAIRAAVRTVLGNPSYRHQARHMRDEIRALPSAATAVTELERVVDKH